MTSPPAELSLTATSSTWSASEAPFKSLHATVKVPSEVVSIPTIDIVCAGPVAVTFAPASNTKLYTTATALETLGPSYKFHTTVEAAAPPSADGALSGDLRTIAV